mgnify:CR=1 FL=1
MYWLQTVKGKKELIRIVRDKENNVVDLTGKQNGRGAYICEDVHCLEKAMKTKALEKTLKVSVDSEIFEKLKVKDKEESDPRLLPDFQEEFWILREEVQALFSRRTAQKKSDPGDTGR